MNQSNLKEHPLAAFGFNDFDKYNCLKLSKSFYLILIYLMKGYVIGAVSLSNFKDKLTVIKWFYPDSSLFYLSLGFGIPGLCLMFIIFQRKPQASVFFQKCWENILVIATSLVVVDLLIYWGLFILLHMGQWPWLLGQTSLAIIALSYCKFSHRAQLNRKEFPQLIEQTKKRTPYKRHPLLED